MNKRAEIIKMFDEDGHINETYVELYKDNQLFGTIDTSNHSTYYADDVAENWESGILKEENIHIAKENLNDYS
jgi:hypothetical protein